ncbi:MAG TPA: ribose-5-phosphate isomerase, partial [Desulfurella acetivorans]|nr:ribose-5-phosphate isomerase [Desulfurella acetivorans]
FSGVRCALCHDAYTAEFARKHNNANILAFGGRTTGVEIAKQMVYIFLNTSFEGGRHQRRVNKIDTEGEE